MAAAPTGSAAAAEHAHAGAYAANRTHTSPTAPADNMQYGGGPIQLSPQVYLVFWGSQWDSDTNGIPQYMNNFFNGLGTSSDAWSTITSQYTDSSGSGPTFGGPVLAGSWVDDASAAPTNAAASDIAAEADNGASHFGVAGQTNAQIVVLSPHGTHPDGWPSSGFCAWHDYDGNVSYTNMPYQLDAPTGSRCPNSALGHQLDAFSIVEGHEYAESISDPQPGSGYTNSSGQEIGDVCESNFQMISLPTGSFAVQPLWNNNAGACTITP
jgi:serine protease